MQEETNNKPMDLGLEVEVGVLVAMVGEVMVATTICSNSSPNLVVVAEILVTMGVQMVEGLLEPPILKTG